MNEVTGSVVDVSDSVPGPTADINLLAQSGLMARLPEGVGGIGDLAYVGIDKYHPQGLGASPRRKPRQHHSARVCAVAGLVNRQLAHRMPA